MLNTSRQNQASTFTVLPCSRIAMTSEAIVGVFTMIYLLCICNIASICVHAAKSQVTTCFQLFQWLLPYWSIRTYNSSMRKQLIFRKCLHFQALEIFLFYYVYLVVSWNIIKQKRHCCWNIIITHKSCFVLFHA